MSENKENYEYIEIRFECALCGTIHADTVTQEEYNAYLQNEIVALHTCKVCGQKVYFPQDTILH